MCRRLANLATGQRPGTTRTNDTLKPNRNHRGPARQVIRQCVAAVILAVCVSATAQADSLHHPRHILDICCPHCGEACHPTVTKETETKKCWDVETKAICIPKVRFPWHKASAGKGIAKDGCRPTLWGRVKHVNVLVFHEYECQVCKYTWNPRPTKTAVKKAASGKIAGNGASLPATTIPAATVEVPTSGNAVGHSARSSPVSSRRADRSRVHAETADARKSRQYLEFLTGFFNK